MTQEYLLSDTGFKWVTWKCQVILLKDQEGYDVRSDTTSLGWAYLRMTLSVSQLGRKLSLKRVSEEHAWLGEIEKSLFWELLTQACTDSSWGRNLYAVWLKNETKQTTESDNQRQRPLNKCVNIFKIIVKGKRKYTAETRGYENWLGRFENKQNSRNKEYNNWIYKLNGWDIIAERIERLVI